jgi:hypothetical protein
MADCLRKELLYSEKRPRDLLFKAIERILSEHTAEAGAAARRQAEASGFEFRHWDTASRAVVRSMLCAGVLLTSDGSVIVPGITAQATVVSGLLDGYQDITEAFLLQFLIEKLEDVTTRDHTALAHALFRQFDPGIPVEELEDRVVILIAQLADRLDLCGDRYCVRELPGA